MLSYPCQACWRWCLQCCSSATLSLRKRETLTRPPCLRTQVNTQRPVKVKHIHASITHDSCIWNIWWPHRLSQQHNSCLKTDDHFQIYTYSFSFNVSSCYNTENMITKKFKLCVSWYLNACNIVMMSSPADAPTVWAMQYSHTSLYNTVMSAWVSVVLVRTNKYTDLRLTLTKPDPLLGFSPAMICKIRSISHISWLVRERSKAMLV